jgi:hypothetical protein
MSEYIDIKTYEFDFGKYKNYKYIYVLNQDPSYIKWLVDNESPEFSLSPEDMDSVDTRIRQLSRGANPNW